MTRRLPALAVAALAAATAASLAQPPLPGQRIERLGVRRVAPAAPKPVDRATADRQALDAAGLKADDPPGE